MNTFTTKLTSAGSIVFNQADGAQSVSVQCSSAGGSCTFLGSFPFKGLTPQAITFSNGEGVTINNNDNPTVALDGITITWVSGTVNVVVGMS